MGLIERANEIRTETQNEANTAQRVGSLFVDIVTPASGRLSYFNNISISIEQGVPKKIDLNCSYDPKRTAFNGCIKRAEKAKNHLKA